MCVTQGSQQAASKGIYLVVPVSLAVAGLGSDWMVAGRPCELRELANALTVVSAGKLCSRPLGGAIRRLPNLVLLDNLMGALIRTDTVAPVMVALPTLGVRVSNGQVLLEMQNRASSLMVHLA